MTALTERRVVDPTALIERSAVVAVALTWLGTPYHHAADIKGVGVDCAMILVRVFAALGAVPMSLDPRPYDPDWMLHRGEESYLGWLQQYADLLDDEHDRLAPGDVPIWRFGRTFSHAAIALDDVGNIIHAYRPAGEVVLGSVRESELLHRDRQVWRVRGLAG